MRVFPSRRFQSALSEQEKTMTLLFHALIVPDTKSVSSCALSFRLPVIAFSFLSTLTGFLLRFFTCALQFFRFWQSFGLWSVDPCISLPWSSTFDNSAVRDDAQFLVRTVLIRFWVDQTHVCASWTNFPEYRLRYLSKTSSHLVSDPRTSSPC